MRVAVHPITPIDSMSHKEPQVIDGSHLDQTKLIRLLEAVYGKDGDGNNKFRVEVHFIITKLPHANCSDSQ